MPKESAPIQLLDLVYRGANQATAHSWERLNHAMREALKLAIGAGFEFAEADIKYVHENYHSGYWLGDSTEWIYTDAIVAGNMTAVASFESFKKRTAAIADDVELPGRYSPYLHGGGSMRKSERLAVGCRFKWKGVEVAVTSFNDEKGYVSACSYKMQKRKGGGYEPVSSSKIDRRFKITRADLIADRAERKERAKLLAQLDAAATTNDNSPEILKKLGIKNRGEFDALPIEKIRKVAAEYAQAPEPEPV